MSEPVCVACRAEGHTANDYDRPWWCRRIGEADAERAGAGRLREETITVLSRIQQLADFALDDPEDRKDIALRGISVRAGQLLVGYGINRAALDVEPGPVDQTGPRGPVHRTGQPGQPRCAACERGDRDAHAQHVAKGKGEPGQTR